MTEQQFQQIIKKYGKGLTSIYDAGTIYDTEIIMHCFSVNGIKEVLMRESIYHFPIFTYKKITYLHRAGMIESWFETSNYKKFINNKKFDKELLRILKAYSSTLFDAIIY